MNLITLHLQLERGYRNLEVQVEAETPEDAEAMLSPFLRPVVVIEHRESPVDESNARGE